MSSVYVLDAARMEAECRYLARKSGQPHAVISGVHCRPVKYTASPACVGCGAEPDGGPHLCASCALVLELERRKKERVREGAEG